MGPWTHMDTKIKAQVYKVANLGAIWSQLGPIWAQLGRQLGSPREVLGGPPSHPGGSCLALGGQDGPKTPKEALQDRFWRPTWPSKSDFEANMAPRFPPRGHLEANFGGFVVDLGNYFC